MMRRRRDGEVGWKLEVGSRGGEAHVIWGSLASDAVCTTNTNAIDKVRRRPSHGRRKRIGMSGSVGGGGERVRGWWSRIDLLCHAIGVIRQFSTSRRDWETWDRTLSSSYHPGLAAGASAAFP